MKRTDTIIIGGGQAGLAMSRCLTDRAIDHVVLERGRIAERWRSERWDSSGLLTPRWQSRLPGWSYQGHDPDGFMTMPEIIDYFTDYALSFSAPVEEATTVLAVEPWGTGYRVSTDRGEWTAPNVVLATGHCDVPFVPEMGSRLSPDVQQLVPTRYRNPRQLADGGVLVVGASATGIQLADEIARSGRRVTVAVGRHTRLPRLYRGRDIMSWLDEMGIFDDTVADVRDVNSARRLPSFQLVGRADRGSIDLGLLQERGVRLVGRALGVEGGTLRFADDLADVIGVADAKMTQILGRVDDHVDHAGLTNKVAGPERCSRVEPAPAPTSIDLRAEGIGTVLWATGYRRDYSWLKVPVLDENGELVHDGGITPAPGLYALGLRFLRRRNSSFIDGVGQDAVELSEHLAERLEDRSSAAA